VRPRASALVAALVAAGLLASCDRPEAPAARTDAPAATSAPELALPAAGETRVERRGERYAVAASEATPEAALTELSLRAGFRLERGSGPLPDAPRTLWLHDVSLERAVAAILAGVPHHVHYEFVDGDLDPTRAFAGRPVALTRVTLGALAPSEAGEPEGVPRARAGDAREAPGSDRETSARGLRDARAGAGERADDEALAREARDPDPDVRLEAIEAMDPDGDRAQLERMLRDDPSGEVRAAAAELLGEADAFAATPGLLAALADPEPAVVESAVRALEDVYDEAPDPRIREGVALLREHRDADVRAAVEEFESWIEE
jgi:hypothetical protein